MNPAAAVMQIPNLGEFRMALDKKDWTAVAKWHAVNTPWLNDDQVNDCIKHYQFKVRDEEDHREEIQERIKQLQIQKRDERRKK